MIIFERSVVVAVEIVDEARAYRIASCRKLRIPVEHALFTGTDYGLVRVLGSTMKSVFPNVYVIDVPSYGSSLGNSLVVATRQPTEANNFIANAVLLQQTHLQRVVDRALAAGVWELESTEVVFTDDKAPVEQVIHQLIVRYMFGE